MSMDEMLMNELYGSDEIQQEEQIKQAQVELVEAVAAEAGVDLNELDDDELAKFAHYVLSEEDENDDVVDSSDDTTKLAALEEADLMGRQMAHSYVDELNNITQGDTMYDDTFTKVASAMEDVAEAWGLEKEASMKDKAKAFYAGAKNKARSGYRFAMGADDTGAGGSLSKLVGIKARKAGENMYGERAIRGGLALGTAGAAAYGAKKGIDRLRGKGRKKTASYADLMVDELEKSASFEVFSRFDDLDVAIEKRAHLLADAGYEALAAIELCTPEEFAKEAEFRAAEILAANGVHPETFEDIEPEEIKVASFPGVEYAADEHEAAALEEYNEMLDAAAVHIIENLVD